MLTVHHGNRLEVLAEAMAHTLRTPAGAALAPETVVVPNAAVGRWLALRLADHLGIAAGLRTMLPAELAWSVFAAVLGDVPERTGYDRDALVWRILAALEEDLAEIPPLAAYVARAGHDPRQRLALARRLAQVFDTYQVHRPDWILAWDEGGGTDDWQAALWRRIAPAGAAHWPRLLARCLQRLESGPAPAGLPPRLSLFAPPALSPGYLDLLAALGRHIDVALYLLDPCEEYWGDVIPERVRARRAAAGRPLGHAESGNPLLASLGRQSRDLLDALWDRDPVVEAHFRTPEGPTLLTRIQRDILRLVPPQAEGRFTPPADDVSLQLHVCHSPMREVEVLHERLLDLFGRLPGLAATDVAVLVPDIREYAPLVEAVFGAAGRIPYTVADRPAADASPLAAGFLALLAAAESRFEVDRIVDLLEVGAVRRRLGLGADDLTRIRHWLGEAGVRWGRDAAHRAAEGLPAEDAHTWTRGLRRLLLGHALPGHGELLYEGVVPCDHVEGQAAEALGVLCDFVEALDELRRALAEPRPMAAWRDLLLETLERFFLADEDEADERAAVAEAVEGLAADAGAAGHRAPVDAELVRAALESRLARPRGGSPRLAQGVVVAPMTPLRGLPFRVVCLLGLEDGVFPRPAHDDRLDRTRTERRRADPDPRDEDRGIFLDALVSAREVLHLSCVGRDPRDDAPRPPSVLVGELMDYVRALHGGDPEGVRRIMVHHRLQPFHPDYFRPGGPLHAHDAALCEGARRLARGEPEDLPPEQRLFPQPLPEPAEPPVLAPDSFARFFRRPVAFLLRERLGLRLETRDETLDACEPFLPDPIERHRLRSVLLAAALRQGELPDEKAARALLAGLDLLPHGTAADAAAAAALAEVAELWRNAEPMLRQPARPPLAVDLEAGPVRIVGAVPDLREEVRLVLHPGRLPLHRRLPHWVLHLMLAAAGAPLATCIVGTDRIVRYEADLPQAEARALLAELGATLAQGLRRPLPFFPRLWAAPYARRTDLEELPSWLRPKVETAEDAWEGRRFGPGAPPERDDAAVRFVYGDARPYGEMEFEVPEPLERLRRLLHEGEEP